MKNRFKKPLCPGRAPSINQRAEVPPLHHSPLNPGVSVTLQAPCQSARHRRGVTAGPGRPHSEPALQAPNMPLRYLPPRPACSRCRCRCLWAGSRCRSPGWGCCCYWRGYTGMRMEKNRLLNSSSLESNYCIKRGNYSSG